MADQQLGIKVPQELIEDIVRAEVVRALRSADTALAWQ
jgi:hypothetical protein